MVALALAIALVRPGLRQTDSRTGIPKSGRTRRRYELSDPSHPEWRSTLSPTADPNRFTSLVEQYVALATSDDVMSVVDEAAVDQPDGTKSGVGAITATSVASPINGAITPLLKITGIGDLAGSRRRG